VVPPPHRTMVTQLFEHERIQTTLPKAKQLRKVADRMITLAKRVSPQHWVQHKQHRPCSSPC
jgi:ribosomal protein L17